MTVVMMVMVVVYGDDGSYDGDGGDRDRDNSIV